LEDYVEIFYVKLSLRVQLMQQAGENKSQITSL
jgi:hypothetical protein